jgi:nitrous oxide reductase accessory protein NosL
MPASAVLEYAEFMAQHPSGLRRRVLAAVAVFTLALAGCKRADQSASPTADLSTQQADAAAAVAAVTAPDPSAPAPPVVCAGPATGAGRHIDFGVLGSPENYRLGWEEADPDFDCQSAKAKLALFRRHELHPRQGTIERPVIWTVIEEDEALQRALYYAVLKAAPGLITARDRRWVKQDEAYLIDTACRNRGSTGVLFAVPEKDCPAPKKGENR